jgi:two-component system, chemotaxis family, chemotaxis protein CheY
MKFLIVDDSKAMRMIVQRNLRQAGFGDATVVEAADGQEGVDKAIAESPDVILSDWNMPNMNGLEFLTELRARGNGATFGFVTSESTGEMREQAIAAGADFFLAKPFTAAKFTEVVGAFT